MPKMLRVTSRNALFQQMETAKRNREKRTKAKEFFLEGVHPIENAIRGGFAFSLIAYAGGKRLSGWAEDMIRRANPDALCEMDAALHAEISDREEPCELIAMVKMRSDPLEAVRRRILETPNPFLVLFDRPISPGNLGTVIRSADAFGAAGVLTTGHAADFYDPQCVRASIGTMFNVPFAALENTAEAMEFIRSMPVEMPLVGTSAHGTRTLPDVDFTSPFVLLIGNETFGLSKAWKERCGTLALIPIHGAASSINAGCAASICLYEAARQRRFSNQ